MAWQVSGTPEGTGGRSLVGESVEA
jgi:hypothetical protein